MGRALALCLLPILLACLSFALAFEAAMAALSIVCVICLFAAAALFVMGCIRMVGSQMFGSFRRELQQREGSENVIEQEQVTGRTRSAWVLCAAGAVLLALGFVIGGEPLVNILGFLASL